jgi:hypothetical protein
MRTSAFACSIGPSLLWLLLLITTNPLPASTQNATLTTSNSSNASTSLDLSDFVNVTIPLRLLPNDTLVALNLTGNNSLNSTSVLLNPNDPDSGDLRFYLRSLNTTNSSSSTACSRSQADYVVLAIQWPVFLCSHSTCSRNARQNWTVHGLWPSSFNTRIRSHPEYCCTNDTFDLPRLQSMGPRLSVIHSSEKTLEVI